MPIDDLVGAKLLLYREVAADVFEEGARRPREVMAVVRETLDRGLAGTQQVGARLGRACGPVARQVRGELAIDRAAELVDRTASLRPKTTERLQGFPPARGEYRNAL